jgi:multicomponent Na+:H+ antiporter subunit B
VRLVGVVVLALFGGLLVYAASGLPPYGQPEISGQRLVSPAGSPVAATYQIQHAFRDAATPNMVTVILADYRSWDTLGEVVVVFAAGIACFFILRRPKS